MASRTKNEVERAVPVVAVLALAACGGFASCFLSGYDKVDDGGGGAGSTASSASGSVPAASQSSVSNGSGGEDVPRCETTDYPEAPTGAPTTPALDQWFAVRRVELGDTSEPAEMPGFDLDLVDSCNDGCRGIKPECTRPDFLEDLDAGEEARRCDWPGAVDNVTVHLFKQGELLGLTDSRLSSEADDGEWSLLIRLSAWNGTADDASVTVSLYSTPGWQAPEGGASSSATSTGAGGADAPTPAWDGTDTWAIDSRSLLDGVNVEAPAFRTTGGYVSNGTLVAELGGDFYVGTARVPLKIATGRLLAPLVLEDGEPPELREAVFAGRWRVDDLIDAVGSLVLDGDPICTQSLFTAFAQGACRLVDVNGSDQIGACDALSFGIRFDAGAMLPGAVLPMTDGSPCKTVPTCAQLLQ